MKLRILASLLLVCSMAAMAACEESATSPSEELVRFGAQLLPSSVVPPVSGIEANGSGSVTITFKVKRDNAGAISSATVDFQVTLSRLPRLHGIDDCAHSSRRAFE